MKASWAWSSVPTSAEAGLPDGITLSLISCGEIDDLISKLSIWYPDIATGTESCHLERDFYLDGALLLEKLEATRNVLPLAFRAQGQTVGLITLEKNDRGRFVTSRMGALDPAFRGFGIANSGPAILEAVARKMGAGLAYYFATTKIPHQQRAAEKAGYQLVGIMPAFDLDTVSPGQVRRVHEVIYAKVLAKAEECYRPGLENLTPRTQELWKFLFGEVP